MSEFTKIATITFELVYESEEGESEFEFKKRIYRDIDSLDFKNFNSEGISKVTFDNINYKEIKTNWNWKWL